MILFSLSANTCKLISLNVRGIDNFKKRKIIFAWCRKQKSDFIFLQETHSKKDSEACWENEWESDIIMAHGSSNSWGVDCTIHSKILDPLGRYVILKAEINDKMYVLINVYAPNKDANIIKFLNNLLMTLRKNNFDKEENIVIAGEQERDRRLILLSLVSGTFLKRTALLPTWGKMWAHSWRSFVLATGMNGMWTNSGAKALVLSSSSVTWVMFFMWILANVDFRSICHGQRLLVQAITFSFHLKSIISPPKFKVCFWLFKFII